MYKVLIPVTVSSIGPDFLKEQGYEVVMGTSTDPEDLKKLVADVDAMIVTNTPVTEELLAHAPKLKIVSKHGIGVNTIDIDACTRHNVWVTNCPTAAANAVAEHALALIVSIGKQICQGDAAVRDSRFNQFRTTTSVCEFSDSTLGLVGVGRIGMETAKKAAYGLGMKVLAYDPYADPSRIDPCIQLCDTLDEIAEKSDFVSVHTPLTPSTKGMINGAFIRKMKPTAFLINTARGAVIQEDEMIEALKQGVIRGAALDVFTNETILGDDPLCELPNVILTPHYAALTDGAIRRMSIESAKHVDQLLSGHQPECALNKIN